MCRNIIRDPLSAAPVDLTGNAEQRIALFQQLIRNFAELLVCWRNIVEASRDLQRAGYRPCLELK